MTVNFSKDKFNLREKLKELERPSVDKLVTKDKNGAYIDTIRGNTKLESISSSVSGTAVDVFVYDTSKDSDGGAWRKRTQHTSWYSETLGTATRGTRKEFPAVAVIVAETSKVTIYDGDDPDLPMWMVFEVGRTPTIRVLNWHTSAVNSTISSTFQLNGKLCIGSAGAVTIFDFVSDDTRLSYNVSNWELAVKTISNRNDTSGAFTGGNGYNLLHPTISDIAMTVLPNAPIDSATGLPVPTIVVGTLSGVSVIKDDGNVYDFSGFNPIDTVHIDSNNVIASVNTGTDYIFKTDIPSADETYNAGITAGSKNYYMNSSTGSIPLMRDINVACTAYNSKEEVVYRGGNAGFDIIRAGVNYSQTHSNPSIAYISKDYNTGYMVGDIKGAFLSDTDTTNVTGSELITNPGPSFSNTSGWGATNGSLSVSSGDLLLTGANNVNEHMYSTGFTLTSGKTYVLSVDSNQLFTYCRIGTDTGLSSSQQLNVTASSGLNSFTFTASATGTFYLKLGMVTSYVTGSINSVSLRLAELDRSINNNGLQVFGTVTKTAVATGAELVAYSGFSASNYLQQPYNTDYSFGTGDFYVMTWVYPLGTSAVYDFMLELNDASTVNRFYLIRNTNGRVWVPWNIDVTGSELPLNKWSCVVAQRKSGTGEIYVNGEFILSNAWSSSNNLTQTGGTYIGVYPTGGSSIQYPLDGKLSLMRIGAGAISREQIKKMYDDEKFLFHENAKATLYGSSDAVTALAYDDTTNLLHAGTSAGRSDFQGLRRINNTTTAVTTAISAHDEFIIEQ